MSVVHVTIDRIVLRGFEPAQRTAMLDGLRTELERALRDPAMRAQMLRSHTMPVIRMGRTGVAPGLGGMRRLGQMIGQRALNKAPARGGTR